MYGYPQHTKHSVREKLSSDTIWIEKAILLLYSYQTSEEKDDNSTSEQNSKGFNYHDAPILSSYAEQLLLGRKLGEKPLEEAKKRLPKYAGQVLDYIQHNPNHSYPD